MLAELAAINAAFAIIKQTVANGSDLAKAGNAITDFVSAKDTLESRHRKKKSSPFGNELQEFLALDEVKRKEDELRSYMNLYGRAGIWNDWVKFQGQARIARQKAQERAKRRRANLIETIGIASLCVAFICLFCAFAYWIALKKRWL